MNESEKRAFVSKDGKAFATFSNGDTYDGEYKGKKRHGKGTYTWESTGAVYTGLYADGKRDGKGTMTYPDGSVYVGLWRKNKRHGHGVYTYANGDKYCGNWEADVRSGQGTYLYLRSKTQFTGQWVNGSCPDGKWSYYSDDLQEKHRPFVADVRSGRIVRYVKSEEENPKLVFEEKKEEKKAENEPPVGAFAADSA
jgi:hypothetical protein